MLKNAIEEVIDLAVYLETLEEQLKKHFSETHAFVIGEGKEKKQNRKMPRIYVAGPFRGKDAWDVEENIRVAEAFALYIWKAGGAAFCPHANTRFFQGTLPDNTWLAGDLEWVVVSDAMFLVGDWEKSQGAMAEYNLAQSLSIPTFTILIELEHWIKEWCRMRNDTSG